MRAWTWLIAGLLSTCCRLATDKDMVVARSIAAFADLQHTVSENLIPVTATTLAL